MSDTKYGKYIVTKTMPELNIPYSLQNTSAEAYSGAVTTLSLGDDIVKGSFLLRNRLFFKPSEKPHEPNSHAHDIDEALAFFGTNPENWRDLGGEIEFWIEDEIHVITQSCIIFIPKGVNHCPLWIKKVVTPIFHYAVLPGLSYLKK